MESSDTKKNIFLLIMLTAVSVIFLTFLELSKNTILGWVLAVVAIVLFASVRERMEFGDCPKSFEGFPIALVAASLIALAFMGFSGLKVW